MVIALIFRPYISAQGISFFISRPMPSEAYAFINVISYKRVTPQLELPRAIRIIYGQSPKKLMVGGAMTESLFIWRLRIWGFITASHILKFSSNVFRLSRGLRSLIYAFVDWCRHFRFYDFRHRSFDEGASYYRRDDDWRITGLPAAASVLFFILGSRINDFTMDSVSLPLIRVFDMVYIFDWRFDNTIWATHFASPYIICSNFWHILAVVPSIAFRHTEISFLKPL